MIKITTVKKTIELLDSKLIIKRFLLKRHDILKFIRDQNDIGNQVTNKDIQIKFGLFNKAVNKHLRILETREYIIHSKYTENGKEINLYTATEKARIHLKYVYNYLKEKKKLGDAINIMNLISLINREDFFDDLKNCWRRILSEFVPLSETIQNIVDKIEFGTKKFIHDYQSSKDKKQVEIQGSMINSFTKNLY